MKRDGSVKNTPNTMADKACGEFETSPETIPNGEAQASPILNNITDRSFIMEHARNANNRIWLTKKEEPILYEDLDDLHLKNIIVGLENGYIHKNRLVHLVGLKQEKLRRSSLAGKILFGDKGER
jgi:hypothetical protein